MIENERMCLGWIIGFFVALSPFTAVLQDSLVWSLGHGIVGLLGAIAYLEGWL